MMFFVLRLGSSHQWAAISTFKDTFKASFKYPGDAESILAQVLEQSS
jgi:hypothetical protein